MNEDKRPYGREVRRSPYARELIERPKAREEIELPYGREDRDPYYEEKVDHISPAKPSSLKLGRKRITQSTYTSHDFEFPIF